MSERAMGEAVRDCIRQREVCREQREQRGSERLYTPRCLQRAERAERQRGLQ